MSVECLWPHLRLRALVLLRRRALHGQRHHLLAAEQGLTLVYFLAQSKHVLWDTLGA